MEAVVDTALRQGRTVMPPVYFVNLACDSDRRQRMEREFARLGIQGRRFDAVLWTGLSEQERLRLYSEDLNLKQYHCPLVSGEKGCYASHLALWQQLCDGTDSAMVVLEDDVELSDDFVPVIEAAMAKAGDWDMLKLISRSRENPRHATPLTSSGHQLITYRRIPSLTAGYVITRAGAQKLLASRLPFGRPIDIDLRFWWENGLRIRGVLPALLTLHETSEVSSIGQRASRAGKSRWRQWKNKFIYNFMNSVSR
ncbi:glycosyltransferase family 25 protein [Macromonas nakdongensis]|uniref:glycosyltransferase family 25 protein n=1 Tax=Macromonas nakdongensis TaxID=1843082 RepID=UPI001E3459CA|nr:glycosyltransferase family 25 protein [Macromonas nakdongensis]